MLRVERETVQSKHYCFTITLALCDTYTMEYSTTTKSIQLWGFEETKWTKLQVIMLNETNKEVKDNY